MNAIPFVTIFLLTFAFISTRFMTQAQHTGIEQILHTGYCQAERAARTDLEIKAFERFKSSLKKKPNSSETQPRQRQRSQKERGSYSSPRFELPVSERGKINLFPLFSKEGDKKLEKMAQALWVSLYRDHYETEALKQLFKVVMAVGREFVHEAEVKGHEIESLSLIDLYPQEHRDLFYRLLRGTQRADLKEKIGLPSLENFFTVTPQKQKKKAISFSHASYPLLVTLFGAPFADTIIAEEQSIWEKEEKKRPLKKSELEALVLQNTQIASLWSELSQWVSFEGGGRKEMRTVQAIDPLSGITASRQVAQ